MRNRSKIGKKPVVHDSIRHGMPGSEPHRLLLVCVIVDVDGSLANSGSTVRELLQRTREDKQTLTTSSKKGFRCKETEQHEERAEHNLLFTEKAEQSLLFLTAAGTVCSIGLLGSEGLAEPSRN